MSRRNRRGGGRGGDRTLVAKIQEYLAIEVSLCEVCPQALPRSLPAYCIMIPFPCINYYLMVDHGRIWDGLL